MKEPLKIWALFACIAAFGAESPFANLTPADLARGRRLFEAQCAVCHGIDGAGGSGANLAVTKFKRAADDAALVSVIREGIEQTAMPAAWWMSERESVQTAFYVRSLGRAQMAKVPGDAANGKAIFEGKGACASCHIVSGAGGSLGPDLTEIGARRSPAHFRAVLADPAAALPEDFLMVRIVPRSGAGPEIRGIRLNEDSFTIQIRDLSGGFMSFRKDQVNLTKQHGQTPMPSYRGKLNDTETGDLIAYLVSLRGEP
jgi:cytochrome c oxidase cbb3-type subunit III